MSEQDRRKQVRIPTEQIYAAISVSGGSDQGLGLIVNVSEGGLCVRTPMPPPPHARVQLRAALGDETHSLRAVVRFVRESKGGMWDVGVQFAPDDIENAAFIHECFARSAPVAC